MFLFNLIPMAVVASLTFTIGVIVGGSKLDIQRKQKKTEDKNNVR